MGTGLIFKVATEASEFEQIHELNYETFVEEIPQHHANPQRRLVDKFHEQNTYLICMDGDRLAGMVAMRSQRPFSLDHKLPNLDAHLPAGRSVVEIRLLAIRKRRRKGKILLGLLRMIAEYGREKGHNLAVISGATREVKMYRNIGFTPFGPLVGAPGAMYQPTVITMEDFRERVGRLVSGGNRQTTAGYGTRKKRA
ncbi:MAG: GNAT family N-acetyltransferase [Verrucomicrobiota bacterium]|nr:GNAT family N-acetyltransferase [Verrucomicrobiota bacterium]